MGAGDSLHRAQLHKLQALVDMAGITAQDHVLEIGCGWGSLAIHAVKVVPFPAQQHLSHELPNSMHWYKIVHHCGCMRLYKLALPCSAS